MPSSRCEISRSLHTFLILLTFLSAGVELQAQERIEWEPVEGADHYRVEIRQGGELVLETRSESPSIPLFLPSGEYDFQIKVINTFGKTASSSEWSRITIKAPDIPFIIDLYPGEIHEGAESEFRVRVNGLVSDPDESTVFILENNEGRQIELESEPAASSAMNQNGDWAELVLKARRREPETGSWALVMTNPDGRENRMDAALEVLDRLRPKIRKFSPREIPAGPVHNMVILEITGMEESAVVEINGPSEFQSTLLGEPEEGVLEYSYNLQNAVPGWYSITITNPSGAFDVKERAFEILPPLPTAEEIAAANALAIDDREPRPVPEHPNSVFVGWGFILPVGSTSEYIQNSYVGFSLGYSQKFHNDLVRRIPGFSGIAWDITFAYNRNETNYPLIDIYLNRYNFLLGLSYVTPFNFPLNLIVRTGAGLGFSIYTSPDLDRDGDAGGFTLRDLDSMDFIIRFGLGARFDINPRWYVDLTCDFAATFYVSRSAWSLQPRLEGGWRW
jgi:hypothetical protein